MTWVYDRASDTVIWLDPIEELFGFEAGHPRLHRRRLGDPSAGSARLTDPAPTTPTHDVDRPARSRRPPSDTGEALLAPILAPIRHGASRRPSSTSTWTSRCPDGIVHNVVVRASPMPIADEPSDAALPTRERLLRRRGRRRHRPTASSSASSASWSTATACSPRSPPTSSFVHQNGRLVYGNRATARLIGAGPTRSTPGIRHYYGSPITDFTDPTTSPTSPTASPSSPSPASSSSTARSGSSHPTATSR